MGTTKQHLPVKLIAAVALSNVEMWPTVKKKLEARYSVIDNQLEWYRFFHTAYYEKEMGKTLKKCMVSFLELIEPAALPEIKLHTNSLENAFSVNQIRQVNIDPGYLTMAKLVLATTKNFSHRIYLNRGIFADLHLKYRGKHFQPQAWTYPDYRETVVLDFFKQVRTAYMKQLAAHQRL